MRMLLIQHTKAVISKNCSASVPGGLTKARLQLAATLFSPGLIGFAGDENGFVKDEFAPGERERNLKAIPTL